MHTEFGRLIKKLLLIDDRDFQNNEGLLFVKLKMEIIILELLKTTKVICKFPWIT